MFSQGFKDDVERDSNKWMSSILPNENAEAVKGLFRNNSDIRFKQLPILNRIETLTRLHFTI